MAEMTEQSASPQKSAQDIGNGFADALLGSEQPEEEQDQQQEQAQAEPDEQVEGDAEQSASSEELVEIDWNGKAIKVKPDSAEEIKSALMAQADYTRKTQEIASIRNMLEGQKQQAELAAKFQEYVKPDLQTLNQLEHELARFKNVNWSDLDTDTFVRTQAAEKQLKDAVAEAKSSIGAKQAEFVNGMKQLHQQIVDKGAEYLKRSIPKWSPEVQKELMDYGRKEGYTDAELNGLTDARLIKAWWKASEYDKLMAQKSTIVKQAGNAPPVVKPGQASPNTQQKAAVDYKKALRSAKTSQEKSRIIGDRIADTWI